MTNTELNSSRIKNLFDPHQTFSRNLYSVGCASLFSESVVMLMMGFCIFNSIFEILYSREQKHVSVSDIKKKLVRMSWNFVRIHDLGFHESSQNFSSFGQLLFLTPHHTGSNFFLIVVARAISNSSKNHTFLVCRI